MGPATRTGGAWTRGLWQRSSRPPAAELGPAGYGSGARARRRRSSDLLPWLVLPDGAFFSLCGPERRRCKHLEDSDWVMAMQEELNNFTRNEVWVLEAPPKEKNIIGTKWVFSKQAR